MLRFTRRVIGTLILTVLVATMINVPVGTAQQGDIEKQLELRDHEPDAVDQLLRESDLTPVEFGRKHMEQTRRPQVNATSNALFDTSKTIFRSSLVAPFHSATVDVDGDSVKDVISGSGWTGELVWFKNMGDGQFGSAQTISTALSSIWEVEAADINGDSIPDVVVTTYDDIVAFENDSAGNFSDPIVITRNGNDIIDLELADLNGDGIRDIAALYDDSSELLWFAYDGAGSVDSVNSVSTVLENPMDLEIADLNGNGSRDIVVGTFTPDNQVSWFANQGNGQFSSQKVISTDVPFVFNIELADLDQNGGIDVVADDNWDGNIVWFSNDGSGQFGSKQNISSGVYFSSLSTGDVNNDGNVDLAVHDTYRMLLFKGDGTGQFSSERFPVKNVFFTYDLDLADVNGDSFKDYLTTIDLADQVKWYENDGTGAIGASHSVTNDMLSTPREVEYFDMDGDGDLDPIVAAEWNHKISWFENKENGFSGEKIVTDESLVEPEVIEFADLDGDGNRDMIIGGDHLWWLDGDGNGNFSNQRQFSDEIADEVIARDLDEDGDQDIVVGYAGHVLWFENDGTGSFTKHVLNREIGGAFEMHVADLNGDGTLDIVLPEQYMDAITWFENKGGSFSTKQVIAEDLNRVSDVTTRDMNNDGVEDLLATTWTSDDNLVWFENQGGGNFGPANFISSSLFYPEKVKEGDLDEDGDQDLYVTAYPNAWFEAQGDSLVSTALEIGEGLLSGYDMQAKDLTGDRMPEMLRAGFQSSLDIHYNTGEPSPLIQPVVADAETIRTGETIWVDVQVGDSQTGVTNLFGTSFELTYDSSSVHVVDDSAGAFLGSDVVYSSQDQPDQQSIGVGVSRKSGQGGVDGTGIVASVQFKVESDVAGGSELSFGLQEVQANDPNGSEITLVDEGTTENVLRSLAVWPGDTDNNGVVDQADLLPIGLYWNSTGPARDSVSTSWAAQVSEPWMPDAAAYANANGDSVVNQDDVLAIGMNWGKTHSTNGSSPSKVRARKKRIAGSLELDIKEEDGRLIAEVGTDLKKDRSLMGASFTFHYEPQQVDMNEVSSGSRLGDDPLRYVNHNESAGKVSVALSKRAGEQSVGSNGAVARLELEKKTDRSTKVDLKDGNASLSGGTIAGLKTAGPQPLRSRQVPDTYSLSDNYPNPFNPSTTIEFGLPERSDVRLAVYTVTGRKVATLVNETRDAGSYKVQFDARQLASGVYIYRLETAEFKQTRQMMLVK